MYNIKTLPPIYSAGGWLFEITKSHPFLVLSQFNGAQKRSLFYKNKIRNRIYHERKLVGFSAEQMYDVVSDVKHYKDFLPFCKKSLIIKETPGHVQAKLEVGFPPISESYTSNVTLIKPKLVKAVCSDGRLFNHLVSEWKFSPGLKSNPRSSIIDFYLNFEFKSYFHSHLANVFFETLGKQMERAFFAEATRRYGKESFASHSLIPVRSSHF